MIHLIKSRKGFEVVTFKNGNVGMLTLQGYARKSGAISRIRTDMKDFGSVSCVFQDDTTPTPTMYRLGVKGKPVFDAALRPKPVYVPKGRK